MNSNEQLKALYEAQHEAGYASQHTPVDTWEESLLIHSMCVWTNCRVLEIGCGSGRLAAHLAAHGAAEVVGLDYSSAAIAQAEARHQADNLQFVTGNLGMIPGTWDRIVLQGVLEHMDEPWERLEGYVANLLNPGGFIVTSSPHFGNPRGYVWQTLRLLLGVPMSLTDLHAICPWDMQAWCREQDLPLYFAACHRDWASGPLLLEDYAFFVRDHEHFCRRLEALTELRGKAVVVGWSDFGTATAEPVFTIRRAILR
jgi:SAM-dependent methyltransferase